MMGMISSLLVFQLGQARVWFSMSRDGLLPKMFGRVHPRFRTPAIATWIAGFLVGHSGRHSRHRHALRPVEHRHAVRVRAGLARRHHSALQAAGAASRLPRSRRPRRADPQRRVLHSADGRTADPDLAALLRLADHRADGVLALQPPSQRVQPAERQPSAANAPTSRERRYHSRCPRPSSTCISKARSIQPPCRS